MQTKMIPHVFKLFLAGCAVLSLSACGGGGAEVKSDVSTVSPGQQMIDLKSALESGAISRDEYEQLRKKVLEK